MPSQVKGRLSFFDRFASQAGEFVSGAWFFVLCVLLVLLWAPSYFVFGSLDTWQLVIQPASQAPASRHPGVASRRRAGRQGKRLILYCRKSRHHILNGSEVSERSAEVTLSFAGPRKSRSPRSGRMMGRGVRADSKAKGSVVWPPRVDGAR
ncbi:hypothetical protein GCM10022419_113980 [Nonomuraea rosea]|uniref:Uncharacterized protein n=2 Tax=Nonomuraea rosea TaxID=638574 RepID=A0ABP6ZIN1_9ACTN